MSILIKFYYLILFLFLMISSQGLMQEEVTKYYIDTIEVTEKQFEKKLKSLKEIGGWFCRETNTGGSTGYDCEDTLGQKYAYKCVSEPIESKCSLTKIIPLEFQISAQDVITKYYIENMEVDQKEFKSNLENLTKYGGERCKKTPEGGIVEQYYKDKLGRKYKYISAYKPGSTRIRIKMMKIPAE